MTHPYRDARCESVHLSVVPWRAVCGADVPNQRTTSSVSHVTCPACLAVRHAALLNEALEQFNTHATLPNGASKP